MTTPAHDAPLVSPSLAFRPVRLFVICCALSAAVLVAAALLGAVMFGVFFALGLGMGLTNALLVRRSVQKITAEAHPLKSKMALNSATRLMVISVIGLIIGYVFRPLGLGVVFGLAIFQILLVFSTALPVWKKIRSGEDVAGLGAEEATGELRTPGN